MLNTVSTKYLSNCDLINKYNLKNIHNVPRLKKIVLDFIKSCCLMFKMGDEALYIVKKEFFGKT